MIRNLHTFILSIFSAAALAQPADGQFIHTPAITPGCNGLVTSSAKLANGDLIFAGSFTRCGSVRANRVVRFDGSQFFPLGTGADNGLNGSVRAVDVDGAKIYVGGDFSAAGSVSVNRVAVFDNGTWRSVGRGASNGVNGIVRAVKVFQGRVYVGGSEQLASNTKPMLREWNGATWRNLIDFDEQSNFPSINAFEVANGLMYFGGTFKPVNNSPRSLGSYNGIGVSYIDFPVTSDSVFFSTVRELHWFQGRLCVGGSFVLTNNLAAGVACKTPDSWQGFGTLRGIRTLADNGTSLFAAGIDNSNSPGEYASVYALGASTYTRAERQTNDLILTINFQGDGLILGGALAQKITPAFGLLRLRKGQFEPLAQGDQPSLYGWVQALASGGETMYATSEYSGFPHPLSYSQIAKRVNGRWQNIPNPPSVQSVESGLLSTVSSQLHFSPSIGAGTYQWDGLQWNTLSDTFTANATYGNSLIYISSPGASDARTVLQLSPTGTTEFLVQIPRLKRNGQAIPVTPSLVEYQGQPVIAGPFDEIEGSGQIHGVAIFRNGVWQPLGAQGLRDPKWTTPNSYQSIRLLVLDNELYAANGFTEADGEPVDGIARFDGTNWQPLGAGLLQSTNVAGRADVKMIGYQNSLYAFGTFDRAGGQPARNIAQWDGARWRPLGPPGAEGLEGVTHAAVVNGELHLSGEIHESGGEPADYYAVWRGHDRVFASGFE